MDQFKFMSYKLKKKNDIQYVLIFPKFLSEDSAVHFKHFKNNRIMKFT